jgi:hypothetical protein
MKKLIAGAVVTFLATATGSSQQSSGVWHAEQPIHATGIIQAQTDGVVRIWQRRGQDLLGLLAQHKHAHSIAVVLNGPPPFAANPSPDPATELKHFTDSADAVARMRITNQTAKFNERRDWITSTSDAVVLELYKNSQRQPLTVGQTLSIPERGGEIVVNGKRIVASVVWARRTEIGREYLVFWRLRPDGTWLVIGEWATFELQGARWVRLMQPRFHGGVEELGSDAVVEQVRANARSQAAKGGVR